MEENAKKNDSKLQKKLKKLTNPSSPEIWNVFVKNVEKTFNIFLYNFVLSIKTKKITKIKVPPKDFIEFVSL